MLPIKKSKQCKKTCGIVGCFFVRAKCELFFFCCEQAGTTHMLLFLSLLPNTCGCQTNEPALLQSLEWKNDTTTSTFYWVPVRSSSITGIFYRVSISTIIFSPLPCYVLFARTLLTTTTECRFGRSVRWWWNNMLLLLPTLLPVVLFSSPWLFHPVIIYQITYLQKHKHNHTLPFRPFASFVVVVCNIQRENEHLASSESYYR